MNRANVGPKGRKAFYLIFVRAVMVGKCNAKKSGPGFLDWKYERLKNKAEKGTCLVSIMFEKKWEKEVVAERIIHSANNIQMEKVKRPIEMDQLLFNLLKIRFHDVLSDNS